MPWGSAWTQPCGWPSFMLGAMWQCLALSACPLALVSWSPPEGINGQWGGRDAFGLAVVIYYCSGPTAKTSLALEEAGLEKNRSSESFTLQPKLVAEERKGQAKRSWEIYLGQLAEGAVSAGAFTLGMAWELHRERFSIAAWYLLQETTALPCFPLVGFMTVNHLFPLFSRLLGVFFKCKSQSLTTFASCLRLFNNLQISAWCRAAGFWVMTALAVLLTAPYILCWRIA